jgi:hypothetical protein
VCSVTLNSDNIFFIRFNGDLKRHWCIWLLKYSTSTSLFIARIILDVTYSADVVCMMVLMVCNFVIPRFVRKHVGYEFVMLHDYEHTR